MSGTFNTLYQIIWHWIYSYQMSQKHVWQMQCAMVAVQGYCCMFMPSSIPTQTVSVVGLHVSSTPHEYHMPSRSFELCVPPQIRPVLVVEVRIQAWWTEKGNTPKSHSKQIAIIRYMKSTNTSRVPSGCHQFPLSCPCQLAVQTLSVKYLKCSILPCQVLPPDIDQSELIHRNACLNDLGPDSK